MMMIAACLSLLLGSSGVPQVTVLGPGLREEVVDTRFIDGAEYVPVRALSVLLGAQHAWQAELRRLSLEFEGGPVVLIAGSPFVVVGERTLQLPDPVVLIAGEMWVPLSLFREPAASFGGLGLRWVEAGRLVGRRLGEAVLEDVALEGWADTLVVAIAHRGSVDATVARGDNEIAIVLPDTRIQEGVTTSLGGGGPARSVEVSEDARGVRVTVHLAAEAESRFETRSGGAVLTVWRKRSETAPSIPREPGAPTVVVDPGHGGRDPGAMGKGGLHEKWVTMKVARLLREELMKRISPVRVVLTRKGDVMVPLRERAELANRERADVFVSLHANYSYNRSARGLETYFLSVAKTDEERAVAAMENAPLAWEASWHDTASPGELDFILWDSAQSAWLDRSAALARHIQDLAVRRGLGSRGVKQAGFYVLSGAYMPAVLVEVGFLSHREEEAQLKNERHLRTVAEAIAEGVVSFLQQRETAR
jgi:N-acetylmuramoyl-L-alanine amidase